MEEEFPQLAGTTPTCLHHLPISSLSTSRCFGQISHKSLYTAAKWRVLAGGGEGSGEIHLVSGSPRGGVSQRTYRSHSQSES